MKFLLIVLLTLGDGEGHEYVEDSGLYWYECEVAGVVFESFNPDANWFCEVAE